MNANELRLGNWIMDENGRQTKCAGLLNGQIVTLIDGLALVGKKEELFEPIPLTPEVLEACGYIDDTITTDKILELGDYGIHIRFLPEGTDDIVISDYGEIISIPARIKYLHELQNLYFALVDQELNYNP